jgi:two-component system sensor histidine kinase ResE
VPETGPKEMRSVAASFNRMSAEVRAAQQSQREFLANVSHDLKTPLTLIQGYSQAIIDGAASDPTDAAETIHDEAARLNRMVTELTDLARLQAGRLSMKMRPLELHAIVEAIAYRLGVVARQKNIRLNVDSSPLPLVAGDGDRMVQVLTNLIGNAIKYTPEGGQVWVTTQVNDDGVEVIVRDTGIGIPLQDLPHIFDRFYQVDKSRGPQRGTGLGLAITREIVEAHGGIIDITSPGMGKGTTVTVWLPSSQLNTVAMPRLA